MKLKKFNKSMHLRKLHNKINRESNIKVRTIVLSIVVLFAGIIYFTFARYESNHSFILLNSKVGDFSKVVRYMYDDGSGTVTDHDTPPAKNSGYVISNVSCSNGDGTWDSNNWTLNIDNITGRVECTLTFELQKLNNYLRTLAGSSVVQDDLSGDANMRFVGSVSGGNAPNNYVLFGCSNENNPTTSTCELWRIIGVFNSNTHGRSGENLVKIVKASSIGNKIWNSSNTNDWYSASLKTTLNSTSYRYASSNLVQSLTWKTGSTDWGSAAGSGGAKKLYTGERSANPSNASGYHTTWTGAVGLPYESDYLYATDGYNGSTSRDYCLNTASPNTTSNAYWAVGSTSSSKKDCSRGSWMIEYVSTSSYRMWSMSTRADNTYDVYYIIFNQSSGVLFATRADSDNYNFYGVLPTVYLKENVICKNCDDPTAGTSTNPYKIGI